MIKHEPQFDTDKICEHYSKKDGVPITYVCTSALGDEAQAMDIFYRETPHPEFGNRYFGCYEIYDSFAGGSIFICNADKIEELEFGLVEDDNADFTANVEVLYIGKPNEAFSIVGLFNRRNQKTQVNLVVNLVNNLEGEVKGYRGSGEIQTNVTAAGLQIEDEAEFGKSELGGAVKKAILDAIQKID